MKLTGLYGLYPVFKFFDSSGKLCIPIREGNKPCCRQFCISLTIVAAL